MSMRQAWAGLVAPLTMLALAGTPAQLTSPTSLGGQQQWLTIARQKEKEKDGQIQL